MRRKRVIRIKDVIRRESKCYIPEFNEYHMLAYVAVQTCYNTGIEASVISPNIVFDIVGISQSRQKGIVRNALTDLLEWGLLESERDVDKINNGDTLVLRVSDMAQCGFTSINAEFSMRILTSELRLDSKANTLMMYALLAQYTGCKNYCFPSMDLMESDVNMTRKTIVQSLNNLEELGVIVYDNAGVQKTKNGSLQKGNNIYIMGDLPNAKEVLRGQIFDDNHERLSVN